MNDAPSISSAKANLFGLYGQKINTISDNLINISIPNLNFTMPKMD